MPNTLPENSFNRTHEFVDKIYDEFNDNEIDAILESLHEDLGREASYFCEVCNDHPKEITKMNKECISASNRIRLMTAHLNEAITKASQNKPYGNSIQGAYEEFNEFQKDLCTLKLSMFFEPNEKEKTNV
jgi:hypothetical protein